MNRNLFLGGVLLTVGLGGGFIGGILGRSYGLEQQVEALCSKYAEKRKITVTLQADDDQRVAPFNLPASFSQQENFKAQEVPPDYLRGKIGFQYKYDDFKESDDSYRRHGLRYNYSIDDTTFGEVEEVLRLTNFEDTDNFLGTSDITIRRVGEKISRISLVDSVNNTSVLLKRDYTGNINFKPSEIDEAGARKLFDMYSALFYHFKQEHKIDERIAAYSPRLDITQKIPSVEK